ncbi:hypothetical protein SLEP1_g26790 [Rubroshorea leprosula]|uniref:Uncharacterized protein n=1 Tax=Rubroshorea leprosula TaxID=152421 RepID=A0AAV5JXI1_9ROSI|nr:hypothetical protein SLEP1_g26790 [Rubroshorea leprosula]
MSITQQRRSGVIKGDEEKAKEELKSHSQSHIGRLVKSSLFLSSPIRLDLKLPGEISIT